MAQINHPEHVESLFVEIEHTGSKNVIAGVIYRPPGQDVQEFNDFMNILLSKVMHNDKPVYLMGDFNIDLLNEDVHTLTNEYLNIMSSHSLYPSITKPTRITSTSATLIHNIFTNSNSYQTSGIIVAYVSDHLSVFITSDLKLYRNETDQVETEVLQLEDQNIHYFKSELSKVNWEVKCSGKDVNHSYGNFITKFDYLFDKCCPKSTKKVNQHKDKIKSPWLSYSLLKCIRRKNRLYKKFIRKPTEANKETYKKYRNRLNATLRLAKQKYFGNILEKEKII